MYLTHKPLEICLTICMNAIDVIGTAVIFLYVLASIGFAYWTLTH